MSNKSSSRNADKRAHVVASPDKYRGTLTASSAARAMADGARSLGFPVVEMPLADGGEGTLEVLGGGNRTSQVTGPLGTPVVADWRIEGETAVIEMARASGLALVGGPSGNDPIRATTRGTGELLHAAISSGARKIIVGVGGSATTDGGEGAIEALDRRPFALDKVTVEVACDVTTGFVDAARVYGPQKGADPLAVTELTRRLQLLAESYLGEFGVDVNKEPRAGAAGGLAGGLLALGASLRSGFDLVADTLGFDTAIADAELIVTGEGRVDATSFAGKVVGEVLDRSARAGVAAVIVAGDVEPGTPVPADTISLVERCGAHRAFSDTAACLTDAVRSLLEARAIDSS